MRYFIGFLVAVGLIILLLVLLFHHGSSKVPVTKAPLISYANTDATVRLTLDGPINAPQNHNQVQITVGKDTTTYEQLKGYDGQSMDIKNYPMSENAYTVFLHALQHAGYTVGNDNSSTKDERGYCSLGTRYIFEVVQNGQDLERYWATDCGGNIPATFKGNSGLVLALFEKQVPDYENLTGNLGIDSAL